MDIFHILSTMQHYGYPTRLLDWTSHIMTAAYFACSSKQPELDDGALWVLKPYSLSLSNRVSKALGGIALVDDFDARIRALSSVAFNYLELRSDYCRDLYKSKHIPGTEKTDYNINFDAFCKKLDALIKSDTDNKTILKPIAVEPGNLNARLAAQKGKFTISGGRFYHKNDKNSFQFKHPMFLGDRDGEEKDSPISCLIIPKECKKQIREDLEVILGIDISSFMLDMHAEAEMAARRLTDH